MNKKTIKLPSETDDSKLCFVVMGFGKKTDYETGRTLDLNATYNEIIKPAATAAKLRCVRADEVTHSGSIDLPMFEMLLRADLVIADISTGNANALYELGVRHALRPFSTIIMKESQGKLYFDLNHINTFMYDHLGEDIGASEARRAQSELKLLIETILAQPRPDSPVYTFIPKLRQPMLSNAQFEELVQRTEENEEHLSGLIESGEAALHEDRFTDAVRDFTAAVRFKPGDPYLLQQLSLATYKSKEPSPVAALVNALKTISELNPRTSNDPETLGIAGAIHKRLWKSTADPAELDLAIEYYGRGFEIRKDYYNGENFALCLTYRGALEKNKDERSYFQIGARKAREQIVNILEDVIAHPQFSERSDRKWVLATFANTLFALGREEVAENYERRFYAERDAGNLAQWEIDTYETGKAEALAFAQDVNRRRRTRVTDATPA
jgi:tetratricopeptide (TPR) repeat protein